MAVAECDARVVETASDPRSNGPNQPPAVTQETSLTGGGHLTGRASSTMRLWVNGRGGENRTLGVEGNSRRYEIHSENCLLLK